MKRLAYTVVSILFFLTGCTTPRTQTPILANTIIPSKTSTSTPSPTVTESPTKTPTIPTATFVPLDVVPVSASPLTLTEFNAGTEMKRLNVIGTGTAHDIKFSLDGKRLAIATGRGIYLYDGTTFEQNGFIDVNDSVSAIAFSPDGNVLAVAVDGKASLWNVNSGKQMMSLDGGMISISKLAFGLGGQVAALGGECRGCGTPVLGMILWNAKTGRQIYTEHEIWYDTSALMFTKDGKRLVFGGNRGITTIESKTGKLIEIYKGSKDAGFPFNLEFNNDESHFFISTYFWNEITMSADKATRKESPLPECGIHIARAREVGACLKGKSMVIFDGMNGQKIRSFDIDVDTDEFQDVFILSPDGKFAIIYSYYGNYGVYIIDTETGNKIKTLNLTDFDAAQVGIIEIGGDKKYVAAALDSDGQADIYDLQTGGLLHTIKSDCCGIVSITFAPDQKSIAVVDEENNLEIRNFQSDAMVYSMKLKGYDYGPITFSPDGENVLFIKSSEGRAMELFLNTGKLTALKASRFSYVRLDPSVNDNYYFNKLGHLVMLGYQDSTPFFEDMSTQEKIVIPFEARADSEFNLKFAFSVDERYLVADQDVWDLTSGKVTSTLVGHEIRGGDGWSETIRSLMRNPYSDLLVSVGWDGTTRLWNIRTGAPLRVLNVCCSTSFTPDGRYLITAGDGVMRVWGIPIKLLLWLNNPTLLFSLETSYAHPFLLPTPHPGWRTAARSCARHAWHYRKWRGRGARRKDRRGWHHG